MSVLEFTGRFNLREPQNRAASRWTARPMPRPGRGKVRRAARPRGGEDLA